MDNYDIIIDSGLIYPKNIIYRELHMCSRTEENIKKAIDMINSILIMKELKND